MTYTFEEKMKILEYARDMGPIAAARHFGVTSSTIIRWNHKYQIYETQQMRTFSVQEKIDILRYANEHGLTNAMNHYDIDTATLQNWNKTLKIYNQHGPRHNDTSNKLSVRESPEYKIAVLEYARDNGPSAAARKYNIAPSTIRLWNNQYHIYRPRKHRTFSPEQKQEIINAAQSQGIAHAANKYGVAGFQIQDWIKKQH